MKPGGFLFVFGWPILIALTSAVGLVAALFVEGPWDRAATAIIGLPMLAAALVSWTATRRASPDRAR